MISKNNLPLIEHRVEEVCITQRANDGYINATALCKASNKELKHYLENKTTKDFLKELTSEVGIPTSALVQIIKGGIPHLQGTWVHPQVAINLGQWASPKFAVAVSKWVFDWITGTQKKAYQLPYHIRRYLVNRSKIPSTHFSMLDEMTLRLVAPLEDLGYILSNDLMPDISMGRMFSKWCRDHGYDPSTFPTYNHVFDDGKRPPVQARLYPNILLPAFREYFTQEWLRKRAIKYLGDKDSTIIPALEKIVDVLSKEIKKI
ncbi:MAG: KilA-N domain-containing protein [Spirochaetota bacterium]|nr:KilA-N domain-containing protein [Spirochaetota bacterium]